MWRFLTNLLVLTGTVVSSTITFGQEVRRPYGPFDAVAEGAHNGELRRLSLIDSQLDTVDQLRSSIVPVAQPRMLLGRPDVAVYPYGRRGILGLRPQGYVVVPRSRVVVYRRDYVLQPPEPPLPPVAGSSYDAYGSSPTDQAVRQPIGHESLQSGPNRWEYRPLYADDDRRLDDIHGEIERNLQPIDESQTVRAGAPGNITRPSGVPRAGSEPEELPVPRDAAESREARSAPPVRRQARDIARSAAFADPPPDAAKARPAANGSRRENRAPPPPRPDPSVQPRDAAVEPKATTEEVELRGPLLQNPSTGTREF